MIRGPGLESDPPRRPPSEDTGVEPPRPPASAHIDLEDSFLPGIEGSDERVVLDVELALLAGHPRHRPPREGEARWWEPAPIVFTEVRSREWVRRTGRELHDPDGTPDPGAVDTLHQRPDGAWVRRR